MAPRTDEGILNPAIAAYIAERTGQPDDVQRRLIAATAERTGGASRMQIGSDQGALIELLVHLTGARRAVEVGTFTGYSALCIARALGPDGRLTCCDVSDEWTSIGRPFWEEAGVADRIDLRIAPAVDTLAALPADDVIDVAFVDADKGGYTSYFEAIVPRLRPNGLLLADNTLWSARVLQADADLDADSVAIKAFNDHVAADARVESYILPVGDGVTLIRKR
jgi:caffeoyl-CoA O-methyltransferase